MQEDKWERSILDSRMGAVLLPGFFLLLALAVGAKALVDKLF